MWIGDRPYGGDVVLPRGGVELADGTEFPGGKTLNYPLPLQATTLAAGTRLPVEAALDQPLSLAAGTVLSGDLRDGGGQLLYAAGTVLDRALDLPVGTWLGAGDVYKRQGLAPGGLWVAEGALARWEGAKAPKPGTEGGRQLVTIEQTQSRAILNWDTFNIGRNTTLQFKQGADDAVLNRVVGAAARPLSLIHI